ncbi:Acetyltransferase (GNAT) family protein [Clavibacter michiganensis]|uniref:Acetyltransferase (GNAT) family protein n=1 Tax=Clavibacter michiganensis TaxID=28447 RepID=A0A251YRE6_9MICO|nr:GNAT family N-acetyltransferase [Clavibacter michiganensis]OUE26816.1 Acetyltransferase (GNAT) family protein [Clavibacter michiganensis]
MITELHATDELSPEDRARTAALTDLAFGPAPADPAMAWAAADETAIARAPDGRVAAMVGIVHRDGTLDGRPVRLAGIGGVATLPGLRRRGYGRAALDRALAAVDARGPDLTVLICDPSMQDHYARVGFRLFAGTTWMEQHGARVVLDLEPTMIRPGRLPAPVDGDLDLGGAPW